MKNNILSKQLDAFLCFNQIRDCRQTIKTNIKLNIEINSIFAPEIGLNFLTKNLVIEDTTFQLLKAYRILSVIEILLADFFFRRYSAFFPDPLNF